MRKIKNVLFFCWGNTCKSPAALSVARWLKNTIYKEKLKNINFDSEGYKVFYRYAQPDTIKYIESKGIDMSDFQGKTIDEALIEKNDLLLGMEQKLHVNKLKRKFKHIKDIDKKVQLLLKFGGETMNLDIEGPLNLPPEKYRQVLERVEYGVIKSIEKIIEINKKI